MTSKIGMVTCEIKLFRNYFSLRRRLSEIILFQRMELAWNYFRRIYSAREYFPTCSVLLK